MEKRSTEPKRVRPAAHSAEAGARRPAQGARPAGTAPRRPANGQRPAQRRPGAAPKRRGRKKRNVAPLIALALLLVAAVVVTIILLPKKGATPDRTAEPSVTTGTPAASGGDSFTGEAYEQMLKNSEQTDVNLADGNSISVEDLSITPGLSEDWLNVLLLGADARNKNEAARTDTMIICSINKKTGNVKLASIMRDTAVTMGKYKDARINSAYFYGGAKLAIKTVNEYFGMNIQHYAYVDFKGFAKIAEILGGIDVDITQNEMDMINKNVKEQYLIEVHYDGRDYDEAKAEYENTLLTTYGANTHLNGMQTLGYARIRKLDSDYARAERQRRVLNKLMEGMRNANVSKLFTLATQCTPYFQTNLQVTEIIDLAKIVLNRENFTSAAELRLPVPGTYKEGTVKEKSLLYDMDIQANTDELHRFIYLNN